MIQIDWISGKIVSALPVGFDTGRLITLGPNGEFLDERFAPSFVLDDPDHPSSSDRFRVFTRDPQTLYLSGNPCKIFQRHNLWGPDDPLGLFLESGVWVREKAGLFPGVETYSSCGFSVPQFSRLDLTRSYRFPTHKEAQEFIRWSVGSARSRHGAAKLFGSETAYFGQHSTRWALKVYDKYSEFLKRAEMMIKRESSAFKVPDGVPFPLFLEWSRGVVRFELTLRGPELSKIDPSKLALFTSDDLHSLWQHYFDRIQWTENAPMSKALPLDLVPPKMQPVLLAWSTGADLRGMYVRPTFYRYRRAILDVTGVDIAVPPPEASEVASAPAGNALDPKGWDLSSRRRVQASR
uniref:Thiobacillus thiooxidans plasmid pTTY16 ORF n=1 Tax=Acidithiobacillus thiooxidans TaxID=930 RepID=Q52207_ACITH|nr:unnamed protein product [Acidithiobacillus thiooxidans]